MSKKKTSKLVLNEIQNIPDEVISAGGQFLRGENAIGEYNIRKVFLHEGRFGPRIVLDVGKGLITLNKSSAKNLADSWGRKTSEWIGKKIKVSLVDTLIAGRMLKVVMVEPSD
ncbi:MAG: hypothetical protein QXE51_04055 [Nitrososphaeria archaeon]